MDPKVPLYITLKRSGAKAQIRAPLSGTAEAVPFPKLAMITDCHIHIEPLALMKPEALALIRGERANFDEIAGYSSSPSA